MFELLDGVIRCAMSEHESATMANSSTPRPSVMATKLRLADAAQLLDPLTLAPACCWFPVAG
jgi:hypothetical protein